MYTDLVMDHFSNPRNVGEVEDPDGAGQIGNPVCGDVMRMTIKVDDDRITDVKFKTFGCGAAVATSSMVTEMVMGKTLDEAMAITNDLVAEELGGLPKNKMHCSNLGADALHAAIENYRERQKGGGKTAAPAAEEHEHEGCACPYCDAPLEESEAGYCRACRIELEECPSCGGITKKGAACIHCGAPAKK